MAAGLDRVEQAGGSLYKPAGPFNAGLKEGSRCPGATREELVVFSEEFPARMAMD